MNFRSVADLNRAIMKGASALPEGLDLIVGIPRSGLIAANLLALHLNVPLADLDGFVAGRVLQCGKRKEAAPDEDVPGTQNFKKVLVIDDSVMSGSAMRKARAKLAEASGEHRFIFAAVYVAPESWHEVDVGFEEVAYPRVFEWNFMHHYITSRSCIDIDGVLCFDPTKEQNDDGPRYRRFIAEARPFLIPTVPAGWLVTSRLEKYRAETEAWLRKHNVEYKKLCMLDMPDLESRVAAGAHALFKAQVYKQTDALLFIESNPQQAVDIARLSGKPVLSVEQQCMVYPSTLAHAPVFAKRVVRWGGRRLSRVKQLIWKRWFRFHPPPTS